MAVAAAVMLSVLVPAGAYASGGSRNTCPPGSKRAGARVDSIAQCNMDEADTENTLMGTVQTIINVIIGVLGLVAVIVIVLGGVNFTMSQGDPAKTKKAKDTILYGVIGLMVALLAYAIVNFVLSSVFTATP